MAGAVLDTQTGSNRVAFPSPYVDPALTTRNASSTSRAFNPIAVRDLGPTDFYDPVNADNADLVNHDPDNDPVNLPPPPLAWGAGRDAYANNGNVGQDFLSNQSDNPYRSNSQ